jgi:hypothetical protein
MESHDEVMGKPPPDWTCLNVSLIVLVQAEANGPGYVQQVL